MSSTFGKNIQLSIFGQSHGKAIGIVMDGLPPGEAVDEKEIQAFLGRRAAASHALATPRKERDQVVILSGLLDGKTCGAPLCAIIENGDQRSRDYEQMKRIPRPSHSDYPAFLRYGGFGDVRGGGHFSGRLTAPLCIAGSIAMQILQRRGIFIGAHIRSIGSVEDHGFDPLDLTRQHLQEVSLRLPPVISEEAGKRMLAEIAEAKEEGDSLGGIIECGILGVSPGIGNPMFDGWENRMAQAAFGIPAVRGIEFGTGFAAAGMKGSQHNDPYQWDGEKIITKTNHHGGVLGGISTGMPILFRVAFKPTSSISLEQQSVDLKTKENVKIQVEGRHDPCITLRAAPAVEAAAAVVTLDMILEGEGRFL